MRRHILEGFFGKSAQAKKPMFNLEQKKKDIIQAILSGGPVNKDDWDFVNEYMDGYAKVDDAADLASGIKLMCECFSNDPHATFNFVDVGGISDFSELMSIVNKKLKPNFNFDISKWDVSNAVNMHAMFAGCYNFNCDLSMWKVSNVTDMSDMFLDCSRFNGDLSSWDTSNVIRMDEMFYGCDSFNCDLSGWDVSNVTNMYKMFYGCENFNGDITTWDTAKVYNMSMMLSFCKKFAQDISGWNVSSVKSMEQMFNNCISFDQDLSHWNVANVIYAHGMFYRCPISEEHKPQQKLDYENRPAIGSQLWGKVNDLINNRI